MEPICIPANTTVYKTGSLMVLAGLLPATPVAAAAHRWTAIPPEGRAIVSQRRGR